jgi:hypothetical protein
MELTQENYGYDIEFTVKRSDGTIENLTGVNAILFQVADADNHRNIVNGACVITNPTGGLCKYTVLQGDFAKAGNFKGSLQIQYSINKRVNTKAFFITINKKLGPTA